MRKPVISQAEFEKQHLQLDEQLRKYRVSKRGRGKFDAEMKRLLSLRHAESLKAINAVSRIATARSLVGDISENFTKQNVTTAYFITILSDDFVQPLDQERRFDTTHGKAWIRRILGDIDHIGFWEAAYYYRLPIFETGNKPYVVWHTHLIAWNISHQDIADIKSRIDEQVHPLLPGVDPFHYRILSPQAALGRTRYMSKGCISEYCAYPEFHEMVDPETGEIIKVAQNKWINRKRAIRPGSLANLTLAINDCSISDICFAGGKGKKIRREALKTARLSLLNARLAREQAIQTALGNV